MASRSKKMIDGLYALHERLVKEIQARLDDKEHPPTLAELTGLISKVGDLRMSAEWSKKLQAAILKTHGALLTNPGARAGSLTETLKMYSQRTDKVLRGDGRRSGTKLRRAVGDGVKLPLDEESV
jgi:hypothetical protein